MVSVADLRNGQPELENSSASNAITFKIGS